MADACIGIDALMQVSKEISGRKAQPIRTALRFLHLWPWRPWNCTGPALALLAAAGCPLKGETPDAIIGELISTLERAGHLATGEQDTLDNLAGVE
jgi:hypothetical protein